MYPRRGFVELVMRENAFNPLFPQPAQSIYARDETIFVGFNQILTLKARHPLHSSALHFHSGRTFKLLRGFHRQKGKGALCIYFANQNDCQRGRRGGGSPTFQLDGKIWLA